MSNRFFISPIALAIFGVAGCSSDHPPAKLGYEIVATMPHEADAYTQGFQIVDGRLFESAGQYGESSLRELDPTNGKVLRKRSLSKDIFAEGLTILNKELWVLTWKEGTVNVFEPDTFKLLRSYHYKGEGWGLTTDGKELVMSDGSSTLKFLKPGDFSVARTVEVTDGGSPVKFLNELEWIDGQIYANVYTTHRIARISPESGKVTGWLDLTALNQKLPQPNHAEVLNGIAWDRKTGHFLVTGKYWPSMFEIKVKEN